MKKIYCMLFVIIFSACTSLNPYPLKVQTEDSLTPAIGIISEVTTGSVMVSKIHRIYAYRPGYIFLTDFQPPRENLGFWYMPRIPAGSTWQIIGTEENDAYYVCSNSQYGWTSNGVRKVDACIAVSKDNKLLGHTNCFNLLVNPWDSGQVILKPTEVAVNNEDQDLWEQELIYIGKAQTNIRIAYREYKNTRARPAFYQELTFDLSEDKNIAFREMTMEILEATNRKIKFIVKSALK